jgi:hypothetical protein
MIAALPGRAVAEGLSAPPSRVASALELLPVATETSGLRGVLDSNGISIRFVQMAPNIYARYSVTRRAIEMDERWRDADERTLATVIAHEAVHAEDAVNGYLASGGATACIGSEIRAFRTASHLWVALYGPRGKADPQDELERQLNLIAEREQRDPAGLEQLVRQAYTDQCGS